MLSIRLWRCGVLALVTLGICGCGDHDGTTRYDVSGTVTYGGKPVPAGEIVFMPDGSKHNQGAPGFTKIMDGKFDTALDGKGHISGPHVARISGFDGRGTAELPDGAKLFPDYTIPIDLPKEKANCDFDIPPK
jgi:hypothetical protein